MQNKAHWEKVYSDKAAEQVSWYQPHAELSLQLIRDADIDRSAAVIDVGGGASTLVDDLLAFGYHQLTVLDWSATALNAAQTRLAERAGQITWLVQNIVKATLPEQHYTLWHDRAVFHFLTTASERQAYVQSASRALKPGGYLIVATFAQEGPQTCSGLPVRRYNASELFAEFASAFRPVQHQRQIHNTPAGKVQMFTYIVCQKQL